VSEKDPTENGQDQTAELAEEPTDTAGEPSTETEDTSIEVEIVAPGTEDNEDQPETEIDETGALRGEIEDYKDRWVRATADVQNIRKRTLREIREMQIRAGERILQQLLEPVDNLHRALESTTSADSDENGQAFIKGIEMVQGQLMTLLERESVKPMESVGQAFDPMKHEAMMMLERTDVDEGTVVEEIQRGYMLGERVLRHARVIVAKAPAEPKTESTEDDDRQTNEQ
jgi:molecular chaperone GrpE